MSEPAPAGASGTEDAAETDLPPLPPAPEVVRLDVWLWSARLAKTRSAATTACRGGHVRVNGQPVKASQKLRVGDVVTLTRPGVENIYEVVHLLEKRVGAPIARRCYIDRSPPPPPRLPRSALPTRDPGTGRPSKKERRELDRLRGRDSHRG